MPKKTKQERPAKVSTEDLDSHEIDLYAEFGLTKEATPDQIKRAYYKLALTHHPDKARPGDAQAEEEVKERFQEISKWYGILSDPVKRKRYDATGIISDKDFNLEDVADWDAYFRNLWGGKVTEEAIDEFAAKYKGSSEEQADIIKAYTKCKGDMNSILNEVPLISVDDEERVEQLLRELIDTKEIKEFKKFKETTTMEQKEQRRQEAIDEAEEAEKESLAAKAKGKAKSSKGKNGPDDSKENSLAQLLSNRAKQRHESLIDGLMNKYVNKPSKKAAQPAKTSKASKKGAHSEDGDDWIDEDGDGDDGWIDHDGDGDEDSGEPVAEPTEEEFEAIQKRILKRKPSASDTKKSKKKPI
ncbi:uncharacterized protein BJ171DRAFT_485771 [Polychytrium aggregatum]|uniref:uncharacterized protein n=1 Tax=Polychytrium aggregatum TaxID=110093 RepID=UPI0022FDDAC1|nr:uncharacterized protein BJ171DRAFT_485771 [Polychytrium aggregatum]KAI9209216.1 hypothetical protein BJ171DRAFT_485771 [Polychytrium aggregatum]